jgi:hypothetical protein
VQVCGDRSQTVVTGETATVLEAHDSRFEVELIVHDHEAFEGHTSSAHERTDCKT